MKISEVIPITKQGEGPWHSWPATFVRTAKCNLSCSWCDTKYSWEKKWEGCWDEFTFEQIHEHFFYDTDLKGRDLRDMLFVLTGGEPLIHQKDEEFLKMVAWASDRYKLVTIETNGTIPLSESVLRINDDFNNIWISCSPKLSNSGDSRKRRVREKVIRAFNAYGLSYFKFVVSCEEDVEEIQKVYAPLMDSKKIWLMPLGATLPELEKNKKIVLELCDKWGFEYSPRIHVEEGLS